MRLRLYYDPGAHFKTDPVNVGFDHVPTLLSELDKAGNVEVQIIHTTGWSDEQRREVYLQTWVPAQSKKFAVGKIFGSNRFHGRDFGKGVPGLLVHEEGSRISPADVYPHEEKGRLITIADYLRSLLS